MIAKDALIALPDKYGENAISLSQLTGRLTFTKLQTAIIRISTASPPKID